MTLYSVATGNVVQAQDVTQFVQLLTGSMSDQPVTVTNRIRAQLTGATAGSGGYVGQTSSGPPTTGTFNVGDFVIDGTGMVWTCVIAGTPAAGRWRAAGTVICTNTTLPSGVALYNGLHIYETNTGLSFRYNGTKWIRDELTLVETASTAVFSSSKINAPNLWFDGDAGGLYYFNAELHYTAFPTPLFDGAVTFPTGSTVYLGRWLRNYADNSFYNDAQNSVGNGFATSGGIAPNGFGAMTINGTILFGSTGQFRVMFSQTNTDGSHPSYLLPGSSLTYRQIS